MRRVKFLFIVFVGIGFILSCKNQYKDSSYLTVVLPCKQDTTGLYLTIQHMDRIGKEYQLVQQDTEYVRNLISKPIIKHLRQSVFVKNTEDLSGADSAIIVIELEPGIDRMEARYDIKDRLEQAEKDLPNDLPRTPFILTRHIRNNKNQGVTWARGDAYDAYDDCLRRDPDYVFRKIGEIF